MDCRDDSFLQKIKAKNGVLKIHLRDINSLEEEDMRFDHWSAILTLKKKYKIK